MSVIIKVACVCMHLVSSRCLNFSARRQMFHNVRFLLVVGVISVMDISSETRAKVIALREHTSKTFQEIGKICGVSTASVGRIWKRFQETGKAGTNRSGRCGRKRSTSARDDKTLHRMSVKNPRLTSFDLSRSMAAAGVDIAPSTVRYRLLERGRRARRPYKKQLLTSRMKKQRLEWARKFKSWTEKDWEKVLFSDETHFVVQGFRSKFVRRSKGEPLNQHHINQAPKHPPKKMFWGCFSVSGTECLVPVEGMMNSASYEFILNRKVLPTMSKLWPNGDCVFQQDNARCHTSKRIQSFCSKKKKKKTYCTGLAWEFTRLKSYRKFVGYCEKTASQI